MNEIFLGSHSKFTLHSYAEYPSGFSATIFKERATGELTVAFRGTELDDIVADGIADLLVLLGNPNTPLELFFNQSDNISDFLSTAGLDVDGRLQQPLNFTGHSLGGYLALMAGYRYSADFGEISTYNGLGMNWSEALDETIANAFEGILIDGSRITNYFADKGVSGAASPLMYRPGERVPIFIEEAGLIENHAIARLVQSLSVYNLLGLVSPGLDSPAGMESIYQILDGSSNLPEHSLEVLVDQLGTLLGGEFAGAAVKADVGLFMEKIADAGISHDIVSLAPDALDADTLAALAGEDDPAGRGYRYALDKLLPFAVTSGLADTTAAGNSYDLDRFSAGFLRSRAAFLGLLQRRNELDIASSITVLENSAYPRAVFTDVDSAIEIRTFAGSSPASWHVYGSAGDDFTALSGGDLNDYLFGRAGNDTLSGLGGSDILDGGTGDDRIEGGAGADFIIAGSGDDQIHWRHGDGDDVIEDRDDGGDRIFVDGVDLASLRFERQFAGSGYFSDRAQPDIKLHYVGGALEIFAGTGVGRGTITASKYSPASGANYGIVLHEYTPHTPVTNIEVAALGSAAGEVRAAAYDRQFPALHNGLDWANIAIRFNADDVANYSGSGLHGTVSGAFEGGPLGDFLSGDDAGNALHGLGGKDHLEGGAGDDLLEGWSGADTLLGGAGADLLFGSTRANLDAALDPATSYGSFYLAQVEDMPADVNILDGGGGDDLASGGQYSDEIDGGSGTDYLLGGSGRDLPRWRC